MTPLISEKNISKLPLLQCPEYSRHVVRECTVRDPWPEWYAEGQQIPVKVLQKDG